MHVPAPTLPALVPSREAAFRQAAWSLASGAPVVITGAEGSGRTTFGQLLLHARAAAGRIVHRITGAEALAQVPFAALAALAAQMPGLIAEAAEAETITALAAKGLDAPRTILVDHAEHVDPESAAALVHLHPGIELIIATTGLAELPVDFIRLAYSDAAHHAQLEALTIDDARVLVVDLLRAPVNASTLNRLFNLSGGNAMYLRELVIDAAQHRHLPILNGYHTLTVGWEPSGRRLLDLITARLAEQPEHLRDTLELLALTGPLPRSLAERLCDAAPLKAAIAEGLLTVSAANRTRDIAQSFDGSGAQQVNEHAGAMVQLGPGLSPELVRAAASPFAIERHAQRLAEPLAKESLPTATRLHLEATLSPDRDAAGTVDPAATEHLRRTAWRITERTRQGCPGDAVQDFADLVGTDHWHAAGPDAQTLSIQAMFLAMMAEGSLPSAFDEHFTEINWHDVSLDHAVFLTGRADLFLELGNAAEARELCSQSLGLLSMQDRTDLTGFTSGIAAVASALLGDLNAAEQQYREFRAASETSGGIARPEVERLTLLVVHELQGESAASAQLTRLRERAADSGEALIEMRLLHDAWRLRLVSDGSQSAHLDELARIAGTVQGTFAAVLARYADAFRELMTGERVEGASRVEDLVLEHLSAGRALFAGEVAARAAELASAQGDRKRAHALLLLFAKATPMLEGVNTPSLGRARIDPDLLSEREVEVCMAALDGRTNPEIAAELFLSPRTVEGHLQRAYGKLGIADRRQLLPQSGSAGARLA